MWPSIWMVIQLLYNLSIVIFVVACVIIALDELFNDKERN